MPIAIPTIRGWRRSSPELIDASVEQKPSTGAGVVQWLDRLGARWALTVELPAVKEGPEWAEFNMALLLARSQGGSYPWPQPGFEIRHPGTPVIAGAGQTGSALNLSGLIAQYTVRKSQPLSVLAGSRRYLYLATDTASADNSGNITIPIAPMLRASPTNGSAVEIAAPRIEGSVTSQGLSWSHDLLDFLPLTFRIEEVA